MAARGRTRRRPPGGPANRMGLVAGALIVLLLAAYIAFVAHVRPDPVGEELALDRFVGLIEQGDVNDARILDQDGMVVGTYAGEDGPVTRYHVPYPEGGMVRDVLAQRLIEAGVPTTVDQQFLKVLLVPATLLFPALILVVIFVYLIVSYRRGSGMFGVRSGARRSASDDAPVTFADVAGQDAAVAELREVAGFLTAPERFAAVGAKVPKGVLLYGPPGCGKTLLARALAGEAGAAFYSITGSDFVELYVGVGASRVRDLFRQAREEAPAIVFIDELDAVGRRRGAGARAAAGGREEHEQALNQILAELDGFSPLEGIIVIAATNRPDVLDPALLRPGRFDRAIGLELPGEDGRRDILAVHALDKTLDPSVDLGQVAHRSVGMTGADLASVMNEAALRAARDGRVAIDQEDLDGAVDRLRDEPDRQRRLSARDRRIGVGAGAQQRTTFADVAGAEEAIAELVDVRDYLEAPERFAAVGARPSHGFLLVGPPGVGKTLLARAVAGESNAAFLSVAATEFTEIYVGEGAARVRDLFAEARTLAPAIVFIDELDAIGARRGSGTDGHREREQTLNQILIELDGFSARSGVIVMAASNRPELLDPALVRPGRFDRTITVDLPDRAAREEILTLHAADKPLSGDVDLGTVAELTRGMSGADLATVLNDAALLTARAGLDEIPPRLVEQAIERASIGVGRNRVMSEEERRVVATHEAGHALLAWALPTGRLPHRLSIVGHGRALGATWHRESHDRLVHSRSGLSDEMTLLLAGQAAERLVFGEPSTTAADDLTRAARIARRMICELGMSERLGPATYASPGGEGLPPWSEETARIIDEETRRLLDEAAGRALALLTRSRAALDRLTEELLTSESLSDADIRRLAGDPGGEPRRPVARPKVPTT